MIRFRNNFTIDKACKVKRKKLFNSIKMFYLLLLFLTVRGQNNCLRKAGYKTEQDIYSYTEIGKEELPTNIDACEATCIQVFSK